jgi:uncharacterized protein YbjT (DUF2867 family)
MRLTVFGATGRAGGAIAAQARAAGHEIRTLARPADDVRDEAAVERVVKDADAVVSAIGGTGRDNPALLFDGTATVLAAAHRHQVSRLIVIQGFHLPFPGDPRTVGRPLMAALLRAWNPALSADTYRMAGLLRASDLDWTLIRMPRLVPGPPGDGYRTGRLALGPWSTVTTGQVAHFTLACLDHGGFFRDAPMICSVRKRGNQKRGHDDRHA